MLRKERTARGHSLSELLDTTTSQNRLKAPSAEGTSASWTGSRPAATPSARGATTTRRPVDFSSRSQLVLGRLSDADEAVAAPGTVLLVRDLTLRLVQPLLVHALTDEVLQKSPGLLAFQRCSRLLCPGVRSWAVRAVSRAPGRTPAIGSALLARRRRR
jgi:hypothetical protein